MENKIATYILQKYGFKPQPDDKSLIKLKMSKKRLTQIMENSTSKNSPLSAEELIRLMLWLRLDIPSSLKALLDYEPIAADFKNIDHQLPVFN